MVKMSHMLAAIAITGVAVGFASTGGFENVFSTTGGDGPGGDNTVETGKSATLSLAAFDKAGSGSTQVAAEIRAWKVNGESIYLGKNTGSASSRTSYSNYNTGESFEAIAFDSTYPYGQKVEGTISSENHLSNLDVWKGAATSDITITVNDENGDSTSSVNLGADHEYGFDSVNVDVDANDVTYNPKTILVKTPDTDSNVSDVRMPSATEVSVPDSHSDYDYAFEVFDATEGEPLLMAWKDVESGGLVVKTDSDGTSGETMTIGVMDQAPYITSDDGLAFGVEDDASSPSDVGVSLVTKDVTLN